MHIVFTSQLLWILYWSMEPDHRGSGKSPFFNILCARSIDMEIYLKIHLKNIAWGNTFWSTQYIKKHSPTLLLPRVSSTTKIFSTESSGKVPCSSRNFYDDSCNMCWVITLDQDAVGHRTWTKKRTFKWQEMHRMDACKTRLLTAGNLAPVSES